MSIHDNIAIEVFCHPEDVPVRGNAMASGDDAYDKEVEDQILSDLEWNQWAWCTVEVRATAIIDSGVVIESDWLGSCTYRDAQDFIDNSGYYDDMLEQATGQLNQLRNTK